MVGESEYSLNLSEPMMKRPKNEGDRCLDWQAQRTVAGEEMDVCEREVRKE